jgi:hypothetical protein
MASVALQYALTGEVRGNHPAMLPLNSVRKWLHGQWALLFSHADDFASYGFEADRWLMLVRDVCGAADVRPLALACNSSHCANWVTAVGGRLAALSMDETRRYPRLRDANEQLLSEAIEQAGSRFVMILDDALRLRRTFAYGARDRLPSPIDLVAMARRLRSDDALSRTRA